MVLHSSCLLLKQNFNNRLFSVFLCRYHAIHKEVYDWFDISFDKFGRTSSPEQTEICQSIFQKIFDNKWISERTMEQVFNFLFIWHCSSLLFSWKFQKGSLLRFTKMLIKFQLYCNTCERFLCDRLVEGACPTPGCEYGSARGDQCDKCGKLLNPTELKNPRCKVATLSLNFCSMFLCCMYDFHCSLCSLQFSSPFHWVSFFRSSFWYCV